MKVKDLIKKLEGVNPELPVFCPSRTGDYDFCLVSTAREGELLTDEEYIDPEEEDKVQQVFIIDEE